MYHVSPTTKKNPNSTNCYFFMKRSKDIEEEKIGKSLMHKHVDFQTVFNTDSGKVVEE